MQELYEILRLKTVY